MVTTNPCIREGLLFEQLAKDNVQCGVCNRRCIIAPGNRGYCQARANIEGRLYVLTYGDISSMSANPIEKKPLHHFFPGTRALTIGSWGCNFDCVWCQNWTTSKQAPDPQRSNYLAPHDFVDAVQQRNCQGTSFSFTEPTTVFLEYSLDVMPRARNRGFYNTYVTNGYMTEEALRWLNAAGLDAMNIDIKGCQTAVRKYCGIDVEKVWQTAKRALELGIWVEITTLVIPSVNDTPHCLSQIAHRIHTELGADVPWHVSGFHPAYRAKEFGLTTSTPLSTLERAHTIGKKAGLNFVYIGNVLEHSAEHTHCKTCDAKLIHRSGYDITITHLSKDGTCQQCGTVNPILLSHPNG
ncbi:MAG: AmmeMemoRadiSam system radical SAM enzyme [Promethearchaeota archaeon]